METLKKTNSTEPLVSVVIPFYRHADWLMEAVESVKSQTYTQYEIIIVNDGSDEDVSCLLEKYQDIRYCYQDNHGAGSARNKAISESKGDYIAFLDSDDLWLPDKLSKQVEYMESHPEIVWSHCSYETFGNNEHSVMMSNKAQGNMFPVCMASCRIATPCVIIRRNVLIEDSELRFNESMRYGQDFYLWVLLCKKYFLGNQDEILTRVRIRGSNAAKRAFVMVKAKSELASCLKQLPAFLWKSLPFLIRSAYGICGCAFSVLVAFQKICKNEKVIEFLAKCLYVLPYGLLKIYLHGKKK